MQRREYVDDTCEIICEDNGKKMVVAVESFKEKKHLNVVIEKNVKLHLDWKGHQFEGYMGQLSFVSNGPDVTVVNAKR